MAYLSLFEAQASHRCQLRGVTFVEVILREESRQLIRYVTVVQVRKREVRIAKYPDLRQMQELRIATVAIHGVDKKPRLDERSTPLVEVCRRRRSSRDVVAEHDLNRDTRQLQEVGEGNRYGLVGRWRRWNLALRKDKTSCFITDDRLDDRARYRGRT